MPDLIHNQHLIDAFVALMPRRGATQSAGLHQAAPTQHPLAAASTVAPEVTQRLLELGMADMLWDGVWQFNRSPYPSQSEADFALLGALVKACHTLGVSQVDVPAAVVPVFQQSGLYRPGKLDRVVKHDLPRLIASEYGTGSAPPSFVGTPINPNAARLVGGRVNFSPNPPPPRDYVLEGVMLSNKVSVLGGLGGASKTMWAMMLATHVALGTDFMGKKVKEGAAVLILGEEDQEEIDRRFSAVRAYLRLTPAQVQVLHGRVRAFPMIGQDARFTRIQHGGLEATGFAAEVIAAVEQLEQEAGLPVAFVGLDHAGLVHGGDFNSREDVVQTMREVSRITAQTRAAALVLAHSPKTSIGKEKSDQNDVAGSAAWSDLARAVFVMRVMTEPEGKPYGIPMPALSAYVAFSVVKNNYGPTDQTVWLMRQTVPGYGVSVLEHVNLTPLSTTSASASLRMKVKAFIQAHPGQHTKTSLRETRGGKTREFKASKHDVEAAVDDLIAAGEVQLRPPTDAERKQFGLRPQATQVLEVL